MKIGYQNNIPPEALLAHVELLSDFSINLLQSYEKRISILDSEDKELYRTDNFYETIIELVFDFLKLKSSFYFNFDESKRRSIDLKIVYLNRMISESGEEFEEEGFFLKLIYISFRDI